MIESGLTSVKKVSNPPLNEFIVIDLISQRNEVNRLLSGLDDETKLKWLRQYGELTVVPPIGNSVIAYRFRSHVGLEAGFFFRDGNFIFIGDHHTFPS
ncbi:hypothetical protein V144x_47490 [Gimesia aquarii]|uniref:Uncharacterized protein n=1 Tax=Gimesia aquarii TaxID=2527964 RepID=A0A517W1W5_9PLAN|nr:hypothetical protein V144x_47490 [Gimesia aquarii]